MVSLMPSMPRPPMRKLLSSAWFTSGGHRVQRNCNVTIDARDTYQHEIELAAELWQEACDHIVRSPELAQLLERGKALHTS
eukprot:scaffold7215_cov366-Prasinococcus_capsulatus_cf.AAC.14